MDAQILFGLKPLLDYAALERIRARDVESEGTNYLQDEIAIFLTIAPSHIREIREAIDAARPGRAYQVLRLLRFTSENLGAVRLADRCRTLENSIIEETQTGEISIEALSGELELIRPELRKYLA